MNQLSQSEQYRAGYEEARSIMDIAHHPGYAKDHEEAHRVASVMLARRLSVAEAQRERGNIILDLRQKNQAIVSRPWEAKGTGDSAIVRPSGQGQPLEPDADVWSRWHAEMGGAPAPQDGELLPTELR